MSLTLLGWLLIASSIALSGWIVLPLRSGGSRSEPFDLEAWLRPTNWRLNPALRSMAATLAVTAAVFVLVAGIGTATSYLDDRSDPPGLQDVDDEIVSGLDDYVRSIGAQTPKTAASAGDLLPDVITMIDRLAARLEAAPRDVQGWRTLGWSYFNIGRYVDAAAAYAKALEIDPESPELKVAYNDAKAKAADGGSLENVSANQAAAAGAGSDPARAGRPNEPAALRPHESDAAVRSMVDGLAVRLARAPHDVDGWTRLMRSRVVLGEREVATTALRTALAVFKDDPVASGRITEAAAALGLTAE